jgi:hypothetical protein
MHSGWFNGIYILQGRWQHGEKVGYCYPSGLEKTLCKWDVYVPMVTKGLTGSDICISVPLFFLIKVQVVFMVYTVHTSVATL